MSDTREPILRPIVRELTEEEKALRLRHIRELCSSVACLAGTKTVGGKQVFFSLSGFVISLGDEWFWVTAGHCMAAVIESGRELIGTCYLVDHYGTDSGNNHPLPFNIFDADSAWIDDAALGLDVAIIPISRLYREGLALSKIRPFPQDGFGNMRAEQFDYYGIRGFPDHLMETTPSVNAAGHTVLGAVVPVLALGQLTDALTSEHPHPTNSWVAIELADKSELRSVVGMSGGPAIGFRRRPGQGPLYGAIGIQSRWSAQRRVAFATDMAAALAWYVKRL